MITVDIVGIAEDIVARLDSPLKQKEFLQNAIKAYQKELQAKKNEETYRYKRVTVYLNAELYERLNRINFFKDFDLDGILERAVDRCLAKNLRITSNGGKQTSQP